MNQYLGQLQPVHCGEKKQLVNFAEKLTIFLGEPKAIVNKRLEAEAWALPGARCHALPFGSSCTKFAKITSLKNFFPQKKSFSLFRDQNTQVTLGFNVKPFKKFCLSL